MPGTGDRGAAPAHTAQHPPGTPPRAHSGAQGRGALGSVVGLARRADDGGRAASLLQPGVAALGHGQPDVAEPGRPGGAYCS